jgi:VWFA-related protein
VTVQEAGVSAPVKSVARATDLSLPAAVVLAMDTSGSMVGDKLNQAKQAAANLVNGMSPADVSALIAFSDSVRLVQPLGADRAGTVSEINALSAAGNTSLYDAVAEGARVASASAIQRKLVVLLTDGEDFGNKSTNTREGALAAAASSGAIYYVIGVGDATDRTFLASLADRTGGRFIEAASASELAAGYAAISDLLKSQLVVTYTSPNLTQADARTAQVTLEATGVAASANFGYTPDSRALLHPEPTVAPATPSLPQPAAATVVEPEPEHRGSHGSLVIAIVVTLAAIAAGLLLVLNRRRKVDPRLPSEEPSALGIEPGLETLAAPGDVMVKISGTSAGGDVEKEIPVSTAPLTIGWDETCQVILPRIAGVAPQHLRLWRRDGRTMIHNLGDSEATLVNGDAVTWGSVGPGDRVTIGPFLLQIQP